MYNVQAVIVLAELAAVKKHLRDFLHRNILIRPVQSFIIGAAGNDEILAFLHAAFDGIQVGGGQVAGGSKEVAVFIAHRLFPEEVAVGLICKSLMKCYRRRQSIHIVGRVDDCFSKSVLIDKGGGKLIEAVASAALPILGFGNTTLILAGNHLIQPHLAVSVGMVAHLNADVPPPHFVGNSNCRTGAEERIKE